MKNILKQKTLFIALLLISSTYFVACHSQKNNTASNTTEEPAIDWSKFLSEAQEGGGEEDESSAEENPEDTIPYQASYPRIIDLIHTKLECNFDWTKQQMNGIATLTFKPYFYPQNTAVIDAKGFELKSVELLGKNAQALKYTYDGKKINITLDKTYTKSESFDIKIVYIAKPNELKSEGSKAITDSKGLYFINADGKDSLKPQQIWTQGETEATSCWVPTIEGPNEKSTQEMYITAEKKYTIISNGELVSTKDNGNGTKTVYWRMSKPHAPYLFMMVIGEYAEIKDKWRNKEVNYYVEKEYAPYGKAIFGNTPEMMEFFSKKLGYDYAWNKYYQIVVRDYVSGAMENTTSSIFMEALQVDDRSLLDDNWETIIAHELFHHWFGDLVTCESWSNLPLNESFANYSEYLWLEHKFGKDEADYHGQDELEGYLSESEEKQVDLIRFHYNNGREEMFDAHSYNKGGRVLHMLRNYVGDEAFFASLNLYLKKNEYNTAEIHHLRLAFEEVTGEDMNWFFNQWFLDKGHAIVSFKHWYENDTLTLVVAQEQDANSTPIYKLPIDLDIYNAQGVKERKRVWANKAKEEIKIALNYKPALVVEDPEFQILGIVDRNKSTDEWRLQYKWCKNYLGRENALSNLLKEEEGVSPFTNNPANNELLHTALKDTFWYNRLLALTMFSQFYMPNFEEFVPDIKAIATNDSKPMVRARALYLLNSYNAEEFKDIFTKAIDAKPYSVAGAGLFSLLGLRDSVAVTRLPEFEKSKDLNIFIPLAIYFAKNEVEGKYSWYANIMTTTSDKGKYQMLEYFANYLKICNNEDKEKGLVILKDLAANNPHEVIKQAAQTHIDKLTGKAVEEEKEGE